MSAQLPTIAAVAATVCRMLGVAWDPPMEPPLDMVTGGTWSGRPCTRVLLYAPDAVGAQAWRADPALADVVRREAPLTAAMRSVVPTVTPVCFASMFTGYPPALHGIVRYEKPVLACDTLFDRLVRAGRKVAIAAVRDSSIDRIFRGRAIDYFSEDYDPQVTARVLRLIEADVHDLIVGYHQEYDDTMHRETPYTPAARAAVAGHASAFGLLAGAAHRCWHGHSRMIGFVPDHGAHVDPDSERGAHGSDIAEDMDVVHFYGIFAAAQAVV